MATNPAPPPLRRPATSFLPERFLFAACILCLLLAVILTGGNFDTGLLLEVYGGANARAAALWRFVSLLGSTRTLIALVALLAAIFIKLKRYETALWLAGGWTMTSLTVQLLKWLISRERPPIPPLTTASGGSFPSGHAAESLFLFYFLLILLAGSPVLRHRGAAHAGLRELCSIVLTVSPLLIGYSRIYLGVHWPSDVLGGWGVGFFGLAISFLGHAGRSHEMEASSEKPGLKS